MASAPLFVTKPFGKLLLYTDVADTAIFIADAHRDDGKRFVVRADEILKCVFWNSNQRYMVAAFRVDKLTGFLPHCAPLKDLNPG